MQWEFFRLAALLFEHHKYHHRPADLLSSSESGGGVNVCMRLALRYGVRTFADQTFAGRRLPTNICRSDKRRPWHLPNMTFADHLPLRHLPTVTFGGHLWHFPIMTFADRDKCQPGQLTTWQIPTVSRQMPTMSFADQTNADHDICRSDKCRPLHLPFD